ncbi:DUF4878 domain-containing protein [Clostridium chauvoei]|uniref:DUF4878 domain-containing protein n=2 Tax=Clostridium chauvoei TaxID=46867 RepID=A0ABD4RJU8_9CLOT|nr:DUF4878 domain-containing protein [Clostridium chauvoei]ATD56051.1 hypothetical protein BTM20_12910 [Clostridium chauvoei]ATD58198.1 hypothetical protein BTM21_10810 [Clostridium chauvoei]MBX7281620.1 DUF4878 domain-containing protein [Clostridium chauvoei]MBX7284159.1 DUF4878 domain-containing protein [Clostridium chauvoei]MBX7286687.1 DUF4878 domain-containing protein [Clostridium chauvoei]
MRLKKFMILINISICILILVGCGQDVSKNPQEVTLAFTDALYGGDFKMADTYLKYPKYNKLTNNDEKLKGMYETLFKKSKIEILDAIENDNLATIKVKVNSIDLQQVEKYILTNTPKILRENKIETTGDEADEVLYKETINKINDSSTGIKETEVNIYLENEDKKWKITDESELITAMEGN